MLDSADVRDRERHGRSGGVRPAVLYSLVEWAAVVGHIDRVRDRGPYHSGVGHRAIQRSSEIRSGCIEKGHRS